MATVLNAVDWGDMIQSTLRDLGRLEISQIAQQLQDYPIMRIWLKKDRVTIDSGIGIQRSLMTKTLGQAKHVGLMEQDNVNIGDVLNNIKADWRHATTAWGFDVRQTFMNRAKALIQNVIVPQRMAGMIDMAQELENKAWAAPTATNTKDPWGVPLWLPATVLTTGFNGDLATGYTTVGGIDPTAVPNFRHYVDSYTTVTKDDLIKKMRKAHLLMQFKSPVNLPEFRSQKGDRYRICLNAATQLDMETQAEKQNDRLGNDVASMDGQTVFKNIPLTYIPKLDSFAKNPVYMLYMDSFYPVILQGDMFRETGPRPHALMHNVQVTFIDLSYNYVCVDRRPNAVLATGTF